MEETGRCLLVLGGSGTLGSTLTERAEARGWDVVATYLTHPERIRAGTAVRLDLRNREALNDLVLSVVPDVIVHAAVTERSGPGFEEAIRLAGRHVAEVAAESGARLIALSTDLVFDGTAALYTEESPTQPAANSSYGRAKADAERIILETYPAVLVVRTSLIYDFDPLNPQVAWMLSALQRGEKLALYTDQIRCPIWAPNLADALLELAATDVTGVLHVVGPEPVSRYELGVALLDALYGDGTARAVPATSPAGQPTTLHLSVERARALLKRTPLLTLAQAREAWSAGGAARDSVGITSLARDQ